jgi:hypothetical protein
MRNENIILMFLFCVVFASCKSQKLFGSYARQFKKTDAVTSYFIKEGLRLASDSSFRIITSRYYGNPQQQLKDSSSSHGRFRCKDRNIFLMPDGFSNEQFCLHYKAKKLFYYNCELGTRVRFQYPFRKIDNH